MKHLDLLTWLELRTHRPEVDQEVLIAHREGGVLPATVSTNGRGQEAFFSPYGDEVYFLDDEYQQITHWAVLPRNPLRGSHG